MHRLSVTGWFWAIVVAALILRGAALNLQGYWIDEVTTINISLSDWPQLFDQLNTAESNKPPLYYAFMHYWLRAGTGESWVRLPGAVAGALTCGVFFLLVHRWRGLSTALLAAGCLVLNPLHLLYSVEARMYAFFGLFACLSFYFLLRFIEDRKARWLAGFLLFSTLTNYTFTYGFFLLGVGGLMVLAAGRKLGWRAVAAALAVHLLSFLLFVPWILRLVGHTSTVAQIVKGTVGQAVGYAFFSLGFGTSLGPTITGLQTEGVHYFSTHHLDLLATLLGTVVLFAILLRGWISLKHDGVLLAFCLGGVLIFLLLPALAVLVYPNLTYNPRYGLLTLFPLLLTLALGARALWRDGFYPRFLVGAYAFFLGWSLVNFYFNPSYRREDLRSVTQYAEQHVPPSGVIVVCPAEFKEVVEFYHRGPVPLLGFGNRTPEEFVRDQPATTAKLHGIARFVVIYTRPDYGDKDRAYVPWLMARYTLIEQKSWTGAQAFVFAAP